MNYLQYEYAKKRKARMKEKTSQVFYGIGFACVFFSALTAELEDINLFFWAAVMAAACFVVSWVIGHDSNAGDH